MELATAFVGVQLKDTGIASQAGTVGAKAGKAAGDAIEKGVDQGSQRGATKATKNLENVANNIKGAFALGAAVAGIKSVIDAASDLNEEVSKSQVIFGESAGAVREFAKGAESIGQSEKQALQAAGSFAVFGKAAGLAGQDLVDFSVKSDQLASDLSSFFNTSPEQAIQAIGAAFRGESEPIRAYGVLLNDASLKQEALDEGLIKSTTGTLPQAARVQAAYGLIMKQTGDAQGDFARTADGVANSSRVLAAQFENTKASLGQSLLPVFKDLLTVASVLLTVFDALPGPLKTAGIALAAFAAVRGPLGGLVSQIKLIGPAMANANPAILAAIGLIGAVSIIMADLGSGVDETTSQYKGFTKAILDTSKTIAAQNDELINSALENDKTADAMVRLGLTGENIRSVLQGSREDVLNYGNALSQAAGDSEDAQDAIAEIQTRLAAIQWAQYTAAALQFNGAVKTLGEEGIVQAARTAGSSAESVQKLSDAFANGTTTATAISLSGINVVGTMEEVRKKMEEAKAVTEGVSQANADLTNANDTANTALQGISDAYDAAADAASRFKDALDKLVGTHVSEQAAADAAVKSDQALQKALADNGATLDQNTEAGQKNREVIRSSIDDHLTYADAIIKSGGSTADAALKLEQYRQELIGNAQQFGLTREEAETYVAQLGLTPESITTAVELAHLEEEKTRLSDWLKGLEGVPKEKQTQIQALIDQGKIAQAEQELNTLARNRTITFGVRVVGGEAVDTVSGQVGNTVVSGHRASGGPVSAGMLYRVNEYGPTQPEFFVPNVGGTIVPLGDMIASAGPASVSGPTIYAGITVQGTLVDLGDLDRWADQRDRRVAQILGAN